MRRWPWAFAASVLVIVALASGLAFVLRRPAPTRAWTVSLARPAPPVPAGTAIAVVDDRAEVIALDRETGARRWVWRPGVELSGALAYDGGTLYAGLRTGVCAVAIDTGTPRWCAARDAVTRVDARTGVLLVVESEGVTALDASTGTQLWTRSTPDVGTPEIASDGGVLYLAGGRGMVAIDAATGATRWRAPGEYRHRPHVSDGTVYAVRRDPATDRLEARFTTDGTVRYVTAIGGRSGAGPARVRSLVILAGDRGGRPWLQAFGTRTGKRRWRKALEHAAGPPVVIGDLVAFEHGGRLHVRDAARGEEWGAREERVRNGERPVVTAALITYRIGARVRAVRF